MAAGASPQYITTSMYLSCLQHPPPVLAEAVLVGEGEEESLVKTVSCTEEHFQIQVSLSPKFYDLYLLYPCEWQIEPKTNQSLSQMPVLLNIKQLLSSLDMQVLPTK